MTNDQCQLTKHKRTQRSNRSTAPRDSLELYHVIVQCSDEAQQRELYERLTREGLRCRVVVL
jgi:hypothetical protein